MKKIFKISVSTSVLVFFLFVCSIVVFYSTFVYFKWLYLFKIYQMFRSSCGIHLVQCIYNWSWGDWWQSQYICPVGWGIFGIPSKKVQHFARCNTNDMLAASPLKWDPSALPSSCFVESVGIWHYTHLKKVEHNIYCRKKELVSKSR